MDTEKFDKRFKIIWRMIWGLIHIGALLFGYWTASHAENLQEGFSGLAIMIIWGIFIILHVIDIRSERLEKDLIKNLKELSDDKTQNSHP